MSRCEESPQVDMTEDGEEETSRRPTRGHKGQLLWECRTVPG